MFKFRQAGKLFHFLGIVETGIVKYLFHIVKKLAVDILNPFYVFRIFIT
jgi:hypothetical protein